MHGRRLETPPFFLELKSGTMKNEKQPEWLSKHLEENNVEVPTYPEMYGLDLGDVYAHVTKVIIDFNGKKYWSYGSYLAYKSQGDYISIGKMELNYLVQLSMSQKKSQDIIDNWYSEVL